jgi:hypothetical protein
MKKIIKKQGRKKPFKVLQLKFHVLEMYSPRLNVGGFGGGAFGR